MIDEDFRIWLIEVNTNPYFGIPNEYIADLLPQMIDDMTKLVIDPVYPPKNVEERENGFELIYNESVENPVNKRRPFSLDLVYPIPELKQQVGVVNKRTTINNKVSFNYLDISFLLMANFYSRIIQHHKQLHNQHKSKYKNCLRLAYHQEYKIKSRCPQAYKACLCHKA